METVGGCHTRNRPLYHVLDVGDNKRSCYHSVLDKFIDECLTQGPNIDEQGSSDDDFVRNYPMCLLKYFFVYADLKDAVKE